MKSTIHELQKNIKNVVSKTIKKNAAIALILGLFLTSCSKSDEPTPTPTPVIYLEENFLAGYLSQTGFDQILTSKINQNTFENGLFFVPIVKGKITALKVKLPDISNALRVSLWDVATETVIRTEIVNIAAANTNFTFDIADIPLDKNKEYAISYNSNDWYVHKSNANSNVIYPITSGNIRITADKYINGSSQTMPTYSNVFYYEGDLSFNFLQTE